MDHFLKRFALLVIANDGAEDPGKYGTHDWRHEHGGDEDDGVVQDEAHEGDHRRQHQQHQEVESELGKERKATSEFSDFENKRIMICPRLENRMSTKK